MSPVLRVATLLPFTVAAVVCLPTARAAAQAPPVPARAPDSVLYRPSVTPDRIILTWEDDPARSQSITWRTAPDDAEGAVQLAPLDAGLEFAARIRTVPSTSTVLPTDLGPARYHTVSLSGLEPATRYIYRVGDGENWSEFFQFTTAAARPERFSFIYLGDAQNQIRALWSRIVRQAVRSAPDARFIVHGGDLVDRGASDAQWGEWHAAAGWINAGIPSIPAPGNHEYVRVDSVTARLTSHWRTQFALPLNGADSLEESSYYLDYQGARIIVLNSNEHREAQAVWLERVLAENPNRWTIVTFHHPLFSAAGGRDYPELRTLWGPLFERYRVDLVLQGHDHAYARGSLSPAPERGPDAWRSPGATMYVVSVSGAKMYPVQRQRWMTRAAERTPLFQIITIDGDKLFFEARTALGEVYDAFELRKRRNRPNQVVDRIPKDEPERVGADSVTH